MAAGDGDVPRELPWEEDGGAGMMGKGGGGTDGMQGGGGGCKIKREEGRDGNGEPHAWHCQEDAH